METKLSMSVMQNLLATCWFYTIIMCCTGIKTFFLIFYFVNYVLHNRFIFFSFYIFPHWKVDTNIETKWLADLLQQWICKPFCIWVFLEFYWETDVNWLFVIIKSYVKVKFKERNNNTTTTNNNNNNNNDNNNDNDNNNSNNNNNRSIRGCYQNRNPSQMFP